MCLDPDAYKETIEVAKILSEDYCRKNVKVILLPKGDPASIPEDEFVEYLDAAISYSFDLELKITTSTAGS